MKKWYDEHGQACYPVRTRDAVFMLLTAILGVIIWGLVICSCCSALGAPEPDLPQDKPSTIQTV